MPADLLKQVTIRTVQHRLQKDLGLPNREAGKKPFITQRIKKQRLACAKNYAHWSTEKWSGVGLIFSDECNFQVFWLRSITARLARSSDRFDPLCNIPTVKHAESVMV